MRDGGDSSKMTYEPSVVDTYLQMSRGAAPAAGPRVLLRTRPGLRKERLGDVDGGFVTGGNWVPLAQRTPHNLRPRRHEGARVIN